MTDPVRHCNVYRAEGCSHVDGFLCDMETCDILKNFLAGAEIHSDKGYSVGTAEGYEEFVRKRNGGNKEER